MVVAAGVAAFSLGGCAQTVSHSPLTSSEFARVDFAQVVPERYWGDEPPPNLEAALAARAPLLRELHLPAIERGEIPRESALVLSGGSANGAFGAGLLAGWTQSGTRPSFNYVTGVSTGAMIAPFAFLGPAYDEQMVDAYTSITLQDIVDNKGPAGLLFGSAIGDTAPLRALVARYLTTEMVAAIAAEHRKGRTLSVITTHLGALRPVVWDIGAIADNRGEAGVQLIRDVIVASASIPGFFPPVPLSWNAKGKAFSELHVDGAVTSQIFAYPAGVDIEALDKAIGFDIEREIFVIRNSNVASRYTPAPVKTLPIMMRSLDGLLQSQLTSNIENIYWQSRRDGIAFKTIAIPEEFNANRSSEFDPAYMNELAELGREIGSTGDFWRSAPPSLEKGE
ncbi:patatin-like phospholipase family protein [Qipengyuania flava]|uniref:patatin-like phospholipase family protein n=1 Tax=Qipengyuania flava TaxID=192812 RepID=UPI001C627E0D|nr:patatin-like phospholipase family protein [Qipengyuania flava]QYJ08327.1 patatin-like phospholipase family protein [Qipengyuania flava]